MEARRDQRISKVKAQRGGDLLISLILMVISITGPTEEPNHRPRRPVE